MAPTFRYRILVVDDDDAVLETTAAILSSVGYEVVLAHDDFEALAALRGGVPELMITDLHMPGMSGFELLCVVRKRFPSMVVIATSGQFVPASLPDGILADRFIAKGEVLPMELLEVVRQFTSDGPLRAQPARPEVAPVWVPRSGRYVVLTCSVCLRSFSVPTDGVEIGKRACEKCVHCGTEVLYYLDESVVADTPSLVDAMQKLIRSTRKSVESSRRMIDDRKQTASES